MISIFCRFIIGELVILPPVFLPASAGLPKRTAREEQAGSAAGWIAIRRPPRWPRDVARRCRRPRLALLAPCPATRRRSSSAPGASARENLRRRPVSRGDRAARAADG